MKKIYNKKSPLFTEGLIPAGNGKLLDYDDEKTGLKIRYAQFNTRAIDDCPFRSAGCEAVCYATKGNHRFASVKDSRQKSYEESRRNDFPEAINYTVRYYLNNTKRYKGDDTIMLLRLHESGDFYSMNYLRQWVRAWTLLKDEKRFNNTLYTKCFAFFALLDDESIALINDMMKSGQLSINCSIDDTTTETQLEWFRKMKARLPLCNVYYCTNNIDSVQYDHVCDCADCAKCGKCNKSDGHTTVVKIHSAGKEDLKKYDENKRK